MSEFIMIVPPEWTSMWTIDNMAEIGIDYIALQQAQEFRIFDDINEKLISNGWMPEGVECITGVKLLEDDTLYVKFI